MAVFEQIKKYDVAYYGGGGTANGYWYRAIIGLRRDDGSLIGAAYFYRDGANMPATDEETATGYVHCRYPAADFPNVLDLLRNEKPVYIKYVGGWNIASVTTSPEPVGEGEAPPA
jgi:hypothetical protein